MFRLPGPAQPVVHHLPSTSSYARYNLRSLSTLLLRLHTENRRPAVQAFFAFPRLFPGLQPLAPWEAAIETLVVDVQHLPTPLDSAPLYQNSVMCDVLAANPKDIAPLFGRCVRRWFDRIDEEAGDPACVKRVAEYLAVHLSNFGWKWSWDRWWVDFAYIVMSLPRGSQVLICSCLFQATRSFT